MSLRIKEYLREGLSAPICLTWELTYRCNLACVHCLSNSGNADPAELGTEQIMNLVDELVSMGVFYVNVGGGEPTLRPDFFEFLEHATAQRLGIKFSTNGTTINKKRAQRLAGMSYLDVQVSIDGADQRTNDVVRGRGSFSAALRALANLAEAGMNNVKVSVVATRFNLEQLDTLEALAARYGATLRITRLRPSGRGVRSWHRLRPTREQLRELHRWLLEHPHVSTGDSFFHLSPFGEQLDGLNMCGAGRVVCLIDPLGDVYACPFAIHEQFRAGNVTDIGGFRRIWDSSLVFDSLRHATPTGSCSSCSVFNNCESGCMAAKFFAGLDTTGPDPECVLGHGDSPLAEVERMIPPAASLDHSRHSSNPIEQQRTISAIPVSISTHCAS